MISAAKKFDAIVPAGGSSRRFGGADKALVSLGGQTFLDYALKAVSGARRSVVVGPRRPGYEGITWVEETAANGPVSALRAGIAATSAEVVVVLAVDMPLVSAAHIGRLVQALAECSADGVALAQAAGAPQLLAAAYQRTVLQRSLLEMEVADGARLRDVMSALHVEEVVSQAARDCDSPAELKVLQREMRSRS